MRRDSHLGPTRLFASVLLLILLATGALPARAEKSRVPLPSPAVQAAVSRIFEVVSIIRQKFMFGYDLSLSLTAALDEVCQEAGEHRIPDWEARDLKWNGFRNHFVTTAMRHADRVENLTRSAIRAFTESLDDPYTSYLTREEYRMLQAQEAGHGFAGLGVEVAPGRQGLRIAACFEGTPARQRGLRPGEEILSVDGKSLAGLSLDRASDSLLGAPGSTVRLLLRTPDGRLRNVEVKRATFSFPPVRTRLLSSRPAVAYVRIPVFSPASSAQTRTALSRLSQEGVAGYVIDLRDNPGGRMVSALGIGNLLAPGRVLVRVQRRGMPEEVHMATGSPGPTPPMVILVNGGTASSAELLAAALQDNNLATVVGQRTVGKGVIQTLVPLSDGSALRVTSARYTTPQGRDIHGRGLAPDILVSDEDAFVERGLQVLVKRLRATTRVMNREPPRSGRAVTRREGNH